MDKSHYQGIMLALKRMKVHVSKDQRENQGQDQEMTHMIDIIPSGEIVIVAQETKTEVEKALQLNMVKVKIALAQEKEEMNILHQSVEEKGPKIALARSRPRKATVVSEVVVIQAHIVTKTGNLIPRPRQVTGDEKCF
jgi:hypothetical protein